MSNTAPTIGGVLVATALAFAVGSCLTVSLAHAQSQSDMRARAAAIGQACGSDISRFCAGVQRGGGRIVACLEAHATELSASCSAAMPEAVALRDKAMQSGASAK